MDHAIETMTVADAMHPGAFTVAAAASLSTAAATMLRYGVRWLAVVEDGAPVGMVTEHDLVGRGLACGFDPLVARVRDVMSIGLATTSPAQSLDAAGRSMKAAGVPRLVVVDEDRRPVGLLRARDIGGDAIRPSPARRVVFFRDVLDSCGRKHRVETAKLYVAPGVPAQQVVPLAIRRFERVNGDMPWQMAAHSYEVCDD